MLRLKMATALLCVLLIAQHAHAVVNKANSAASATKEEEKKNEIKADERISNSYGPPADDYGPPIGSGFKGPAPVYGPPELTGDHRPTQIFPPPPPELPPPVFDLPLASYGPPKTLKPHYGPPKISYGPPLSLPSKPIYGPPKVHFGPPKLQYGPPSLSFPSFKPPKTQYGPPLKLPLAQYGPPSSLSNVFGSPKPGHGPPIPISLEAYGPPKKLNIQFNLVSKDNYGPPPPPLPAPQYGPPAGDLYGPLPPGPPPGVPAPPTPPDIKYDGWHPIAGSSSGQQSHGQSSGSYGPPADTYGPPSGGNIIHSESSSSSSSHSHTSSASLTINPNVPSDSYGAPIHSQEAQDLQSSVQQSSATADSHGLPPPLLPQFEPLHNENSNPQHGGHGGQHSADHDQQYAVPQQQSSLDYGVPAVEPLSIVKTVGFELLPTPGALTSDLQGLSIADHGSSSVNVNGGSSHSLSTIQVSSFGGDSHGFQNGGADLSLQQLPGQPFDTYGPPLSGHNHGKSNEGIASDLSLPPPPPADSYSSPPLSSYSASGPYPASQSSRGSSAFSSFNIFGSSYQKHGPISHRPHGSFRHGPLPSLSSALIPPRNRDPIKFREPIPAGLLSTVHRYVVPGRPIDLVKPGKSYGGPFSLGQQLPSLSAPISFHQSSSISSSHHKGNSHSLNSALAAPNVQYGTPLTFTDFNTPAPVLTYGAPNFGPASSFVSTSTGFGNNLYESVGHSLPTTYGTPVVNAPLANGFGHDCGFQKSFGSQSLNIDSASHGLSLGFSGSFNGQPSSLYGPPAISSVSNSLSSSYSAIPVGNLDLQSPEQPKIGLKDSYGQSIGVSYEESHESSASNSDHVHSSSTGVQSVLPLESSSQSESSFSTATSFQQGGGLSAEALTASLTAQGYGQAKSLGSNEVDASQYLKTDEGSQALALAQGLTAEGSDGFQIQGSKGTYTLQIQPADGGLGTENSDGSIRHEQVLSNGLLQDILAAIEQPENGRIQLQGAPQAQPLEEVYGDLTRAASSNGQYIMLGSDAQQEELEKLIGQATDRNSKESNNDQTSAKGNGPVALFYDNRYEDSKKEIRSLSKVEQQPTTAASVESQKTESKEKSS